MRKRKCRILYIFWLLVFLQSALEVNACGVRNTFFDDYDTYLAPSDDAPAFNAPIYHFHLDLDPPGLCPYQYSLEIAEHDLFGPLCSCQKRKNNVPPISLNLLYSVLII